MNIRNSAVKIFSAVAAAVMILTTSGCIYIANKDDDKSSSSEKSSKSSKSSKSTKSSEETEEFEEPEESDKSEESETLTEMVWNFVYDNDVYKGTYKGYALSGDPKGEGVFTGTSDSGEIEVSGNFEEVGIMGITVKDAKVDITYNSYAAELKGYNRLIKEGDLIDGLFDGKITMTYYYNGEGAVESVDHVVIEGTITDGDLQGEGKQTVYYTDDFCSENGVTHLVATGNFVNGRLASPYDYVYFNGKIVVDYGTE